MKHRTIALLLAAALGLSLIGGAALAVEDDAVSSGSTATQTDGAPTSGEPDVSPENTEGAEEMESAVYGADAGEAEEEQEEQPPAEDTYLIRWALSVLPTWSTACGRTI